MAQPLQMVIFGRFSFLVIHFSVNQPLMDPLDEPASKRKEL